MMSLWAQQKWRKECNLPQTLLSYKETNGQFKISTLALLVFSQSSFPTFNLAAEK